jgi:hypothetical protein
MAKTDQSGSIIPGPGSDLRMVGGVPTRAVRTSAQQEKEYAEEAMRAAQRHLDQIKEIQNLGDEVEAWRNRALVAERTVDEMKERESDLMARLDAKTEHHYREREQLLHDIALEREEMSQALAVIAATYTQAGKLILDGHSAIDRIAGLRAKISLQAIEAAVSDHGDPHDEQREREPELPKIPPMPSVLGRGPREENGND